MPGGTALFRLDDGEVMHLPEKDLTQIYELLWTLAPKVGAVSLAAVIRGATRDSARFGAPIDLTESQSKVLREAIGILKPD